PNNPTDPSGPSGAAEAGSVSAGGGEAGPSSQPAEPIAGQPAAAGLTPDAVAEHCRDRHLDTEEAIALVAGLAQPQWIARRRGGPPGAGAQAAYATVAGTGLRLPADSPLADSPWLAVSQVERDGGRDALIRAAAPLTQDMALLLAAPWLTVEERTLWQEGRLRAERVRRLGAITLETAPAAAPGPRETARAVVDLVTDDGLEALTWDEEARRLRARLALLHEHLGEPWPSMTDADLVACAETWLAPAAAAVGSSSGRFSLERLDVAEALRALLPWPQAARLEDLVPERLEVPSGSQLRVDYSQGQPVLAVAVQECFGWQATPRIVEGRVAVLLHLLSPARRPVAVTEDLASFWAQGYPQVRAELRGRYPKHAWPEDPGTVPPHRGTRRRST
ncbi:ATP-dependent helicase C-terminal domain-containing protein, partial [Actinomyces slackii]